MLEEPMNINVTIRYRDDETAKTEFIKFLVDYYIEKEIYRKVNVGEN